MLASSCKHPATSPVCSSEQLQPRLKCKRLITLALAVVQINTKNLKDRGRWASGWLQRSEIEAMMDLGATCQVCAGTGHMICPKCKNEPVVILWHSCNCYIEADATQWFIHVRFWDVHPAHAKNIWRTHAHSVPGQHTDSFESTSDELYTFIA